MLEGTAEENCILVASEDEKIITIASSLFWIEIYKWRC
jgi:hypothetical protein